MLGKILAKKGTLKELESVGFDLDSPYDAVPERRSDAEYHFVPWPTRRTSAHPPPSSEFKHEIPENEAI